MQQLSVWVHKIQAWGPKQQFSAVPDTYFSDHQGGVSWIPRISTSERQCLSLSQPIYRCIQEPHIKMHYFKAFGLTLLFLLEQILIRTQHPYNQTPLPFLPQFCSTCYNWKFDWSTEQHALCYTIKDELVFKPKALSKVWSRRFWMTNFSGVDLSPSRDGDHQLQVRLLWPQNSVRRHSVLTTFYSQEENRSF